VQIKISEAKKMPFTMKLKMTGDDAPFAEPPPSTHTIKAPNIIELQLKLNRWFSKYGFSVKYVCKKE